MNPADVAGVCIRYWMGTAEFSIALSTRYQQLLLNPQRGCSSLSGVREWEWSRRVTDTSAANMPRCASVGELGQEVCGDEEILLSSCGLNPPSPAAPPEQSPPPPPPPPTNPDPPPSPPSKPTKRKKPPTHKRKSFESSSSSWSDQALPCGHKKEVKGKQPQQQKRREEPPSLEGDESPDPLLGE